MLDWRKKEGLRQGVVHYLSNTNLMGFELER